MRFTVRGIRTEEQRA